jgi:phosphoserine aminotransferase
VNFAAGPAMLPFEVLEEAREGLTDWRGGMSVMEVNHHTKGFLAIAQEPEALLREIADTPANYKIVLPQGGATEQFAAVPLNLAKSYSVAEAIGSSYSAVRLEASS